MWVTPEKIATATQRLVEVYQPCAVYVFGSFAWGTPHENSDLDLLVVVDEIHSGIKPNGRPYHPSVAGYHALFGLELPSDLLVLTRQEFDLQAKAHGSLMYRIKHCGKLAYAKS
jgi:predicted nucleotidyltransferase